jgi:hypothetical protein
MRLAFRMISSFAFETGLSAVVGCWLPIRREVVSEYLNPHVDRVFDIFTPSIILGLYRSIICKLKLLHCFLYFLLRIDIPPDVTTVSGWIQILLGYQSSPFIEEETST